MTFTPNELRLITHHGGGLILDARQYSIADLKRITAQAYTSDCVITLRQVGHIKAADLADLASSSRGRLIFDLSESLHEKAPGNSE